MSFRIFLSGNDGYHSVSDHYFDTGVFDSMTSLYNLMFTSPDVVGATGLVVSQYGPDANMNDAEAAAADLEVGRLIDLAVTNLTTLAGAGAGGYIAVSCQESHALWPDTVTFSHYIINLDGNPGRDFRQMIARDLDMTSLNTLGVKLAIAAELNKFCAAVDQSATPTVLIQIFH